MVWVWLWVATQERPEAGRLASYSIILLIISVVLICMGVGQAAVEALSRLEHRQGARPHST